MTNMRKVTDLPNGHELFVEDSEAGGHTYWSDEVGGGVVVWDAALVDAATLLAAMVEEERDLMVTRWRRQVKVKQPKETTMILCINCIHYRSLGQGCAHPNNVSVVTGTAEPRPAVRMRESDGTCGPEGRLFVADTSRLTSTAPNEDGVA